MSLESINKQKLIQFNNDNNDYSTWNLPPDAIARLGRGHEPRMAFSPDGKLFAIDNSLGLWVYDIETLSPIALWENEREIIGVVTFSPNGKWIATTNSNPILKVLDIQNNTYVTQVELQDHVHSLTFSNDNEFLAVAYFNSPDVEVYHGDTGNTVANLTTESEWGGSYRPICFSPDASLIASSCISEKETDAESIVVWNVKSCKQVTSLEGHNRCVTTLCFSPCGKSLASGGEDGTVYVWNVDTWQQVQTYTDYGTVYRIIPSYTTDGELRAAIINYDESGPATISVHNLKTGDLLYTDQFWGNTIDFSYIGEWGNSTVFSNGSQLAYECRHTYINLWTPEYPYKRQLTHSPISFPDYLEFSGDGKTLATKHHHEGVVLWDVNSKLSRPAIKVNSAGKNQFICKTDDGKLYVASIKNDSVTLWEADGSDEPLLEATGREYWSAFPTLAPTGTLFAYSDENGKLSVWDVQTRTILHELIHPLDKDYFVSEEDGDTVDELIFNYDATLLVSTSLSSKVMLWNMENGEEIDTFPKNRVNRIIGFTKCGKYLACDGEDQELILWDTKNQEIYQPELDHIDLAYVVFSPIGHCVAYDKGETFVYDLIREESFLPLTLPTEHNYIFFETYSICGQYLVGGARWEEGMENAPVYLWDVASGKHLATFCGHRTDVHNIVFSPDNKLLATKGADGLILIWDLTPYCKARE